MKHWRKAVIALLIAPGTAALLQHVLPREPGWHSAWLLFIPVILAAGASALAPEPGTVLPRLYRFRCLTAAAACYALGILLTLALNFSASELFRGEVVRVVSAFGLLLTFALFAGWSSGRSRKERWSIAAGFTVSGMAGGISFGVALASLPGGASGAEFFDRNSGGGHRNRRRGNVDSAEKTTVAAHGSAVDRSRGGGCGGMERGVGSGKIPIRNSEKPDS
ncbi:MAG: hypothetical protein L6W00_07780 [Lentisphaeria bacterium]|nr:MAG: hypothetical protein L6W00_07780 [Lentisphaeria bacterium]